MCVVWSPAFLSAFQSFFSCLFYQQAIFVNDLLHFFNNLCHTFSCLPEADNFWVEWLDFQ